MYANHETEVLIPNVSQEQLVRLGELFQKEGGTVTGDQEGGVLENECFETGYEYDKNLQLLTLEPIRLVDSLSPRRLRRFIQHMLVSSPKPVLLPTGEEIYKPTPGVCAVYNWAIGYFTNKSGLTLHYSKQQTDNGNLTITKDADDIKDGATPADHKDGFWINQGTKSAGTGCFGWIEYILDDGFKLRLNYGVNTTSNTTASVGREGQNIDRYKLTCDKYVQYSGTSVAAYVYPYVTISKA